MARTPICQPEQQLMARPDLQVRGAPVPARTYAITVPLQGRILPGGPTYRVAVKYACVCAIMFCAASCCPAGPTAHGTRPWRTFAKIDRMPEGAPRYRALRRRVVYVSPQKVAAALARFHPTTHINFLGRQFGVPGSIDFLYLYPTVRSGRADRGTWRFTWRSKAGISHTRLIPIGPPGIFHHLSWPVRPGPKVPLPPFPGIPHGAVVLPGSSIYIGAWSKGMARVTGWIPNRAVSFKLSALGVPRGSLRAFAMSLQFSDGAAASPHSARIREEWPRRESLWPPDKIVIYEVYWPFPSAYFGADRVVTNSLLGSGLTRKEAAGELSAAEDALRKLSPEGSFLLQTLGKVPPEMAHTPLAVRRVAMLLAQASFSYFFHGSTRISAIFTRIGGKDVYAVSCRRKFSAYGGPWFEYYLCFTKSGRLWCIGHQSWKTGRRTPAQLAAMAVNLSGLSKSLSQSPRPKK